jgi:hypothetical protein
MLVKIVSRFIEMIIWLIFLIINIPYTVIILIPYVITGKDFISPLVKLYEKCLVLFKRKEKNEN